MHAFRCSVVVHFVNIIRSLRIVQWSNKLQLPPQIQNVGPFYDLFLFSHASKLSSPSFGSLGVISNELEREECSWISTSLVPTRFPLADRLYGHTDTRTQTKYCNPRCACAPRVNYVFHKQYNCTYTVHSYSLFVGTYHKDTK